MGDLGGRQYSGRRVILSAQLVACVRQGSRRLLDNGSRGNGVAGAFDRDMEYLGRERNSYMVLESEGERAFAKAKRGTRGQHGSDASECQKRAGEMVT